MEKRYVVMEFCTDKETEITDRYCYIMNEDQYTHYRRSRQLDTNLYTITDSGVYERETYYSIEKIVINIFKESNVEICKEFYTV